MKYTLNLAADGRILSATYQQYAPKDAVVVTHLPEGNISDYLYINDEYIYDPLPKFETNTIPTVEDRLVTLETLLLGL